MNILVTGANGQLGNEMRIVSSGSQDHYIFTEVIEVEGQKFDPNFHQAVMRVQNADMEDDDIAQELQKGYMVKGRVIRPSMVQVVAN